MGTVNVTPKSCALITRKKILARILASFLNRPKLLFEADGLQTTFSNVFYFLPTTLDRSEGTNRYVMSVNLSLIDIAESSFETKENVGFDLSKLDFSVQEKEIMTKAVAKMLKKLAFIFSGNLVRESLGAIV